MLTVPDIIKRKVETFHNNLESFKTATYNETQVRREFIDPFFTALGWDIENKAGYAAWSIEVTDNRIYQLASLTEGKFTTQPANVDFTA